jgi:pteridine reductase
VVTGAAVRVGRAIAEELASNGFDLVLHYRGSAAEAEAAADACRAAGAAVTLVQADLATPEGCATVAAAGGERLDLLVNNASIFYPTPFEESTLVDFEKMIAVNLRAPYLISQALLPALRVAGGLVVHLCDIGADRPVSGYAPYSVSKAGLVMLVKAMAVELAPAVRTVGVSPGQVIWPPDYDDALRDKLARRIPMGRVGEPADVARLVRFLALEGTYLNGVIIPVDGGLSCRY